MNHGGSAEVGQDDAESVRAAIASLSWLDCEALVLRFRDRRSLDEIASLTRTTVPMVRVRLHRGALRVEERVGHWPLDGVEPPVSGRDRQQALEDVELGVTPVFADRLDAALRGRRDEPRTPRFGRWLREAGEVLTGHAHQLAAVGSVLGLLAVAAVAVVAAAAAAAA